MTSTAPRATPADGTSRGTLRTVSTRPVRGSGVPPTVYLAPRTEDPAQHAEHRDRPYGTSALPAWAGTRIIAEFCPDHTLLALLDADPDTTPAKVRTRLFTPRHQPGTGQVLDTVPDPNPGSPTPRGAAAFAVAVIPDTALIAGGQADPLFVRQLLADGFAVLSSGGILALPVPDPVPGPGFNDQSGALIRAGQQAGFRYLQHIALVDAAPGHDGLFGAIGERDLADLAIARQFGTPVHARIHHDLIVMVKTDGATTSA